MKDHRLRCALLCVAATFPTLLAANAGASTSVVIQHGDSIDSLARKYHVGIKDIAHANGISPNAILVDGRKLTIPEPPRSVVKPATMHVSGAIKGDRITVRLGPSENYRRLALLDHGAGLTVTRKAGEWVQVTLADGKSGWVKESFVVAGDPKHVAKALYRYVPPKAEPKVARHHSEDSKPARRVARHTDDDEDHPVKHHKTKHTQVASRSRHHSERTASVSHRSHRGRPEAGTPDTDSDVIRTALAYRGTPYRWGGTTRNGFDCSGFTRYVYKHKGVELPHNAAEQYGQGHKVSRDKLKPGDLVFFHTTRGGISHVGLYAGKGKFVHASSGGGRVRVDTLNSGYYNKRLVGARRVK